jgi:hypothetical protein
VAAVNRYTITIDFLDADAFMVQAEGDPYPLGLYKDTGWLVSRLVLEAMAAILVHHDVEDVTGVSDS